MKKIFYALLLLTSFSVYSQKTITADQAMNSNDAKVIAGFIKNNPNDPKTPALRQKLIAIALGDKPKETQQAVAKPKITTVDREKVENKVNTAIKKDVAKTGEPSEQNKKTAALLTHIFNTDPNSKEAYIQIVNKSKCNLIVKISGKNFYNLTVPANNSNYVLLDKGTYTISTSVCDAKYSSIKNIQKDIVVTLNAPR